MRCSASISCWLLALNSCTPWPKAWPRLASSTALAPTCAARSCACVCSAWPVRGPELGPGALQRLAGRGHQRGRSPGAARSPSGCSPCSSTPSCCDQAACAPPASGCRARLRRLISCRSSVITPARPAAPRPPSAAAGSAAPPVRHPAWPGGCPVRPAARPGGPPPRGPRGLVGCAAASSRCSTDWACARCVGAQRLQALPRRHRRARLRRPAGRRSRLRHKAGELLHALGLLVRPSGLRLPCGSATSVSERCTSWATASSAAPVCCCCVRSMMARADCSSTPAAACCCVQPPGRRHCCHSACNRGRPWPPAPLQGLLRASHRPAACAAWRRARPACTRPAR
jgi:hypothetical protein